MFASPPFNEESLPKVHKERAKLNVKNKHRKTIRVRLKSNLSYDPEIAFLAVYHRKMQACLSEKPCMNVYGCFIHNVPKLEAVQMSFSRYMIKQNAIHPYEKYI